MAKNPEFSEFSYGFALTQECMDLGGGVRAAPVLPSLIAEAQLGYDVMLRYRRAKALFLQFKLPELMDHKNSGQWNTFSQPYYRFWITPRNVSNQHKLLVKLSNKGRVYYAAPEFVYNRDLNNAFSSGQVLIKSALFSPRDIGPLTDDNRHCVAYTDLSPTGWFCSKPREIVNHRIGAWNDIHSRIRHDFKLPYITRKNAREMADSLEREALDVMGGPLGDFPISRESSGIEALSLVANFYYGAQMFLIRA